MPAAFPLVGAGGSASFLFAVPPRGPRGPRCGATVGVPAGCLRVCLSRVTLLGAFVHEFSCGRTFSILLGGGLAAELWGPLLPLTVCVSSWPGLGVLAAWFLRCSRE